MGPLLDIITIERTNWVIFSRVLYLRGLEGLIVNIFLHVFLKYHNQSDRDQTKVIRESSETISIILEEN